MDFTRHFVARLAVFGLLLASAGFGADPPQDANPSTAQPPQPPWWDQTISVAVESTPPGAWVLINGYRVLDPVGVARVTPCTIEHLLPGEYDFELFNDDSHGLVRNVSIGDVAKPLEFSLKRNRRHRWSNRDPKSIPSWGVNSARPVPPRLSSAQRIGRLKELYDRFVSLDKLRISDEWAAARFDCVRFDDAVLGLFAPIAGSWSISNGALQGGDRLVSQIAFLLPLISNRLEVHARIHSDGVCELNLYGPNCSRYSGTTAVGRVHFGRMGRSAETDWAELSTRDKPGDNRYGFRIPTGPAEVTLELRSGRLDGSLETSEGLLEFREKLRHGDPPPVVYVGVGGSRQNTIRLHELRINGRVDLFAETTDVLIGMGEEFWAAGRTVALIFNTGTNPYRLLLNGETIIEAQGTPAWAGMAGMLRRSIVDLHFGDVIGFDMGEVTDETALFVVGVDVQTSRVVLATHPLVWRGRGDKGDNEDWFHRFDLRQDKVPRITSHDQSDVMKRFGATLHFPFPGLGITGRPGANLRVALKVQVR